MMTIPMPVKVAANPFPIISGIVSKRQFKYNSQQKTNTHKGKKRMNFPLGN
jgi:hypothetical protein